MSTFDLAVPNQVSDLPATVTVDVKQQRLDEMGVTADQLRVEHYDEQSGWETLETSVVSETDETVTLSFETPGFSLFLVSVEPSQGSQATATAPTTAADAESDTGDTADAGTDTDTPTADEPSTPTETETATTSTEFPGFGAGLVAVAAALFALVLIRRRD